MSIKKTKIAIIGSGNIGTDLMIKVMRNSQLLEVGAMVGIDPNSDGLARASRMGVPTTYRGVEGLIGMAEFEEIKIVFDATSATAHKKNEELLRTVNPNIRMIDLTPAAIGPYCIPVVNLDENRGKLNLNMVTCGGQATIPIVYAVSRVAEVYYAEIVASIASNSAGPGTRANIDEFTETTAKAIERVGKAKLGRAIIILNPAEPEVLMRDTVFVLSKSVNRDLITQSVENIVQQVSKYVPGYRLKQKTLIEEIDQRNPIKIPGHGVFTGLKTTVFLEVEGAAHYLPAYAGNLDIMTSAALAVGESIAPGELSLSATR